MPNVYTGSGYAFCMGAVPKGIAAPGRGALVGHEGTLDILS
ncbi:hypothetical protein BCAR13_860070 [Paraburkholderia caribensis]|nr:hypothetical protein BCAR13_860070 [Paraburkholderia caribensis]